MSDAPQDATSVVPPPNESVAPPAEQQSTPVVAPSDANAPVQQSAPVAASAGSFSDFTDVAAVYGSELQKEFEGLRQRAQTASQEVPAYVQSVQGQIEPTARQLVASVSQIEGGVATPSRPVVQTFLWAGILLLTATLVAPIGTYILAPILGVFLGKSGAALIAYFGVPAVAYYSLSSVADESSVRYKLIAFAVVEALLVGFVLSESYLASAPLNAVTAVAIAFIYPAVLQQLGSSRVNLLGAVLGAAFAVQLVFGLMLGLSGAYFVLALLYSAAAGIVLQTIISNVQSADVNVNMYQLAAFSLVMLSHGLVHLVLGSSQPVPRQ